MSKEKPIKDFIEDITPRASAVSVGGDVLPTEVEQLFIEALKDESTPEEPPVGETTLRSLIRSGSVRRPTSEWWGLRPNLTPFLCGATLSGLLTLAAVWLTDRPSNVQLPSPISASPSPSPSPTQRLTPTAIPTPTLHPNYPVSTPTTREVWNNTEGRRALTLKDVNELIKNEKITDYFITPVMTEADGFDYVSTDMMRFSPKIRELVTPTGSIMVMSMPREVLDAVPRASEMRIDVFPCRERIGDKVNVCAGGSSFTLPFREVQGLFNDQVIDNPKNRDFTFFVNIGGFNLQLPRYAMANWFSVPNLFVDPSMKHYQTRVILRDNSTSLQVESDGRLGGVPGASSSYYSFNFSRP